MTEAEWAQRVMDFMASDVNQRVWGQIDHIADPVQRFAALQGLISRPEMGRMQQFMRTNPRPAPAPVAPTPATPVGPTPEEIAAKRATRIATARSRAQYDAEQSFRRRGLDPAPYMAMINSELDRIQGTIGESDDPEKAFLTPVADNYMEGEEARREREYDAQLDTAFSNSSRDTQIGSSLLDDVIGEILGKQKDNALQYLERGKTRGMYNDVGYNAGLSAINDALSSGRSELGSLGNTVLDKYRGRADTVRDRAYSELGAFDFGDSFNIDPYVTEYQGIINDARNNAGGDLRGLLGGKNFFDLSALTQKAGSAQGALNLRDADVATALAERKRKNSMSRGIGSQGAF